MDVTFLETKYLFNEPSLYVFQGENRHEQQISDWVNPDHTQTEPKISKQINHADLHTQSTSNNPLSNIQHDQNQNHEDNPNTTTKVRSPDSPILPDSMTYNFTSHA